MVIKRIFTILLLSLRSLSVYAQKQTIAVTIDADNSYPLYNHPNYNFE